MAGKTTGNQKLIIGIEIGGTKLQLAVGKGDKPEFSGFWRGMIDPAAGAAAILEVIHDTIPKLLDSSGVGRDEVAGVGIAFGGPVDSSNGRTMVSHQVHGWNDFPLIHWVRDALGFPAILQNDADSAALAESRFGAGVGFDPMIYVTVGSGIGGGLIVDGKIFRGSGAGAMEIGHLRPGHIPQYVPLNAGDTVESIASGFGISNRARQAIREFESTSSFVASHRNSVNPHTVARNVLIESNLGAAWSSERFKVLLELSQRDPTRINTQMIAQAAGMGDPFCLTLLTDATHCIGWALAQAITLINPARIVIGGGVSLIGEEFFFEPVRRTCQRYVFPPFQGLAEIVPAQLGEEVVVHGAVAIAAAQFLDRS